MNATKLYTQLSRKVMLLNKDNNCDDFLSEFMRSDLGLLKLRTLLLCRSCKDLCIEPFSSDFCQHLSCEDCLKQKKVRHTSCKWCRNPEDMMADIQSKILIASYKKLCAILRDFVTGYVNDAAGPSTAIKNKLMKFLDEGCSLPDLPVREVRKEKIKTDVPKPIKKLSKGIQADIIPIKIEEKHYPCPPCCCTCTIGDLIPEKSNQVDVKVKVSTAESSGVLNEKKLSDYSPDYRSDTVSSTVPDAAPPDTSVPPPKLTVPNKHKKVRGTKGLSSEDNSETFVVIKTEPDSCEEDQRTDLIREPPLNSCEFYDALSSISLKERQNRSIFEKFGLALSPTPNKIENVTPVRTKSAEKHRKKLKKNKEKKKKHSSYEVKQKLQPLKLKVCKVNSYNSDGYSVQYNISNSNGNSEDVDNNEDVITVSNSPEHSPEHSPVRKVKRKATFISNYAVFSDDSDFETVTYPNKRHPKNNVKKERPECCSCGSGNHVKYFTNICKRARCPCFSQGRPCVKCKCRFCSNPYPNDNQDDVMFTDSGSENEQPQLTYWVKDETEVVDVESM